MGTWKASAFSLPHNGRDRFCDEHAVHAAEVSSQIELANEARTVRNLLHTGRLGSGVEPKADHSR